ncbi:cupin domain-containing protein [Aminithiophilus ramosus]|uniref:Cupin domain-containing protein n=2 Tax=Synergistales TaxID=649776 RepID=A0A9Q7AC26_9BACT|nr:cupin domain-containing protein [Aminithiophilus ramosus]QTX32208.1 cupin domain-containing protein [Aminithiophilus ramosus]QVL36076.1 cupin domain-containing protein [Synergistota bacterium]
MASIGQSKEGVVGEKLRGGEGRATLFPAPLAGGEGAVTLAARIELEPGSSVGFHRHDDDEEVYAILSGEGIFLSDEGSCPVGPGDLFVTQRGSSHGLRNTGKGALIFFAVVARK